MPRPLFLFIASIMYTIPAVMILWSAFQYFAVTGEQKFSYDFSRESPFISNLWPPEHVSSFFFQEDDAVKNIIKDPVSFSVTLTRPTFQKIELRLKYRKNPEIPLKIGLQKGDRSWDFFFKEFSPNEILTEDGWNIGVVRYDIFPEYITEDNRLSFILSSPYLSEKNEIITLSSLEVSLKKIPLTPKEIIKKIFGILKTQLPGL